MDQSEFYGQFLISLANWYFSKNYNIKNIWNGVLVLFKSKKWIQNSHFTIFSHLILVDVVSLASITETEVLEKLNRITPYCHFSIIYFAVSVVSIDRRNSPFTHLANPSLCWWHSSLKFFVQIKRIFPTGVGTFLRKNNI